MGHKTFLPACLAALLLAAAAQAAPKARCPGGVEPRFGGDPFYPVNCSTAAAPSAPKPERPRRLPGKAKPS
ncbi:MAG: hypothetical protein PHF00_05475, partial [Elusimicrobia bacterium]|nr:hypothetical protein [Elusimicrobiota bacterium]